MDDYTLSFSITRKSLLIVAIVTTVSAFLSSFSPNYISLLILRMLVGTGLGGGPVYGSWFLEFVPSRNRGMWMVIYSTFWTVGTILEALLAMVHPLLVYFTLQKKKKKWKLVRPLAVLMYWLSIVKSFSSYGDFNKI